MKTSITSRILTPTGASTPSTCTNSVVSQIREASRLLLGDLDFMSLTLAGTQNLKPSAVQAVMEIGYCTSITASLQGGALKLDRSDISRILAK